MDRTTPLDVVIIGGGQAGLAMSYHLSQRGIEHIILEQARIGETWRSQRWDLFALVTPNWATRLPGFVYQGEDPDGFMPRDEVVRYLEAYAASFSPPIRQGVRATSVSQRKNHYIIETTTMPPLEAKNVVIATGSFQRPKDLPLVGERFAGIRHLHSSEYRNVRELAPGNVLVVGSGQSGCQIAEELNRSGRRVYLAVSNSGRLPRRYRGHDIVWWQSTLGIFDMTVDQLPSPQVKFAANPHIAPGRDINLRQMEKEGVMLLGRVQAIQENKVMVAQNLTESLNKADEFAATIKQRIDRHVQMTGIQVPEADDLEEVNWGQRQEKAPIFTLDMKEQGITNVVWAIGYKPDYSWVHLPVFDETGYPKHKRGVTGSPGLYLLGLHYLYKNKSALLFGVGEDAAFLAAGDSKQIE